MDYSLITVLIISTALGPSSADLHINHENLVTDIKNTDKLQFTSIAENVEPNLIKYKNEAEVQIYLQEPAVKETDDETIVYSLNKRKNDGSANWFSYATSKGSTREETSKFVKEANEVEVTGTYSYVGDDGVRYIVGYSAGRNGYRPKVIFGKNVQVEEIPVLQLLDDRFIGIGEKEDKEKSSLGGNSDLMCSLMGGGCL